MSNIKIGLTIEEAAECTGIGRNTMRKLVDWGKLPVHSPSPRRLRAKYTPRTNLRVVLWVFRPCRGLCITASDNAPPL